MSMDRACISERLRPFGTTIFSEMTALANEHGAVNLSQGFPDFDGPDVAKRAAAEAIARGDNQYAPMPGTPVLREAISEHWHRATGQRVDPLAEVTVTNGCTEAISAAMLGLLNPGDEVVVFEPYYDCYRAAIAFAGAMPRFVALRPSASGRFEFDQDELERAFNERTRAVLVNTPHNPTGKVFTTEELRAIAELCIRHDAVVIADEVYEHLTYDGHAHVCIATVEGMAQRTLTLSSIGKSYSLTGWKVGWAIGPAALTASVRAAHQFLTFSVATPLQFGAASALRDGGAYVRELLSHYEAQKRQLTSALGAIGFGVQACEGTYFVMADHSAVSKRLGLSGDVEMCRYLTTEVGVAAIPPSVFYGRPELGRTLVRFAFCKRAETMAEAISRLGQLSV